MLFRHCHSTFQTGQLARALDGFRLNLCFDTAALEIHSLHVRANKDAAALSQKVEWERIKTTVTTKTEFRKNHLFTYMKTQHITHQYQVHVNPYALCMKDR